MRRAFPEVRQPPSVRDFFAFEEHVRSARAAAGRGGVPDAWYEIPVFYFSNPAAIYRDGDEVPKPADTAMLDYELELAAVIGTEGGIEGFTIMNDWSARDLQGARDDGRARAGEGQGLRHLARPGARVSPDELPGGPRHARDRPGERRGAHATPGPGAMHWSWDDLLAAAARNTPGLRAGDVIGSGTVGGGCILEHADGRWLRAGRRRGARDRGDRRAPQRGCRLTQEAGPLHDLQHLLHGLRTGSNASWGANRLALERPELRRVARLDREDRHRCLDDRQAGRSAWPGPSRPRHRCPPGLVGRGDELGLISGSYP